MLVNLFNPLLLLLSSSFNLYHPFIDIGSLSPFSLLVSVKARNLVHISLVKQGGKSNRGRRGGGKESWKTMTC